MTKILLSTKPKHTEIEVSQDFTTICHFLVSNNRYLLVDMKDGNKTVINKSFIIYASGIPSPDSNCESTMLEEL
jgi:hypothetical protein